MTIKVQSCLSEKCHVLCTMGNSAVIDMMQKIFSGSITLHEMKSVYQRRSQVEKLCLANAQWNLTELKSRLEIRNKECTAFKQHKDVLGSFCREMEVYKLQIEG